MSTGQLSNEITEAKAVVFLTKKRLLTLKHYSGYETAFAGSPWSLPRSASHAHKRGAHCTGISTTLDHPGFIQHDAIATKVLFMRHYGGEGFLAMAGFTHQFFSNSSRRLRKGKN